MKKSFLFISLVFLSIFSEAQQDQSFNPFPKERPADYEYLSAPDSTGKRTLLKSAVSLNPNAKIESTNIKLPYPIIFIHGLGSNAETWDAMTTFLNTFYNLSNGGRFDYCLNYDGNDAIANTNFYPTIGADLGIFTGTWIAGDYYTVNFDVGIDGSIKPTSFDVNSNQSAIVKQGKALKDAILRVLLLTGRDKVILVGHSMGGLASREYLQNSVNWQADGKHHVAKLITTGTPHGGSNATSLGPLSGTDGQSEAIRDLRRTYYYTGNYGVYLFGGLENVGYMDDQLLYSFYNADVNCNGIIGETITGLNQKSISTTLDYACVIGECSGCIATTNPGDGVVWDVCADLNNYYSGITKNIFYYNASAVTEIHTDLPSQIIQNMQGLDEPDSYALAYHIDFDLAYTGFTTVQASGNTNYPVDFDLYKFTVSAPSNVNVSINTISLPNLSANIIDASYTQVGGTHATIGSSINFSQPLNAGDYYLNILGTESASNHIDPYSFLLSQTPTTAVNAEILNNVLVYPNPANGYFIIEPTTNDKLTVDLYDVNGRFLLSKSITDKTTFDMSTLNDGVYTLTIRTVDSVVNKKLVIVR